MSPLFLPFLSRDARTRGAMYCTIARLPRVSSQMNETKKSSHDRIVTCFTIVLSRNEEIIISVNRPRQRGGKGRREAVVLVRRIFKEIQYLSRARRNETQRADFPRDALVTPTLARDDRLGERILFARAQKKANGFVATTRQSMNSSLAPA